MAAIVYPSTLPCPQAAPVQSVERRLISDPPFESRPKQRDRLARQQITFPPFTKAEMATFDGWWRDTLKRGGARFAADWPSVQGDVTGVFRFVGAPRKEFVPGGFWRVSATVIVYGRGELPMLRRNVAWWEFDEQEGSTFLDATGNEHALLTAIPQTPALSPTPGVLDRSARLQPAGQCAWAALADSLFYLAPGDSFSMGAWFTIRGQGAGSITDHLMGIDAQIGSQYSIGILSSLARFRVFDQAINNWREVSQSTAGLTGWHFLAMSYDGPTGIISGGIDGAAAVSAPPVALKPLPSPNAANFSIGQIVSADGTQGAEAQRHADVDIDKGFFIKSAIGSAGLAYLYNGGAGRSWFEAHRYFLENSHL